jgi:hypothetical protein
MQKPKSLKIFSKLRDHKFLVQRVAAMSCVLGLACGCRAQASLAKHANPPQPQSLSAQVATTPPPGKPLVFPRHGAVGVSGRWVIVVKNRDGSVAQRREFENSIADSGDALLVGLLAGQVVGGSPSLLLSSTSSQPPCSNGCQGTASISVTTMNNDPTYTILNLSTQVTATQDGVIDFVQSQFNACNTGTFLTPTSPVTTVSPSVCYGSTPQSGGLDTVQFTLTHATVSSISVSSGQIISASVALDFYSNQ